MTILLPYYPCCYPLPHISAGIFPATKRPPLSLFPNLPSLISYIIYPKKYTQSTRSKIPLYPTNNHTPIHIHTLRQHTNTSSSLFTPLPFFPFSLFISLQLPSPSFFHSFFPSFHLSFLSHPASICSPSCLLHSIGPWKISSHLGPRALCSSPGISKLNIVSDPPNLHNQ